MKQGKTNKELENVAIADALQLEAPDATPLLFVPL